MKLTKISQQNILDNGQPTIAILIGSMNSSYQEGIMRGASDAAIKYGFNVVGFSGGPLNSPDPTALSRETIFDLVDLSLYDGIVVPVSSLCRYLTDEEQAGFLDHYSSIPFVNIGSEIDGCINIVTDYATGIKDVMNHLINDHGYSKIAFFRGPDHHASSDQRMQIYKEALAFHHIPVDEDLIIYTDLKTNSAAKALTELLDHRQASCQAIITMNDKLALGVINTLNKTPSYQEEKIAVIGSMNDPEGIFSTPPLTTIEEPLYELGYKAIMAISDTLSGHRPSDTFHIPTQLVLRQSCGCDHTSSLEAAKTISNHRVATMVNAFDLDAFIPLQSACFEIFNRHHYQGSQQELEAILLAYLDALADGNSSPFIYKLKLTLDRVLKNKDITTWLEIITLLQKYTLNYYHVHGELDHILALHSHMLTLKDEVESNAITYHSFETDFYINFFRKINHNLNESFNMKTLGGYALNILAIDNLFINLYNNNSPSTFSMNMLSIRNKRTIPIDDANKSFPSPQLIPASVPSFDQRYTLMVFPLSFRKKPLGFIVLDLTKRKSSAYENMQTIISTALKNELQTQELKEAENRFRDIAHSTSDWLWETDENHNFIYSSSLVLKAIGYDQEEILRHKINDFTMPDSDFYYKSMVQREIIRDSENWMYHKSGHIVCLQISATPIMKNHKFTGYRGVFKDVTEQKLQEEKIRNLAYYDILTNLPNRMHFQEILEKTLIHAKNKESKFALMFLDLDHFKEVNDTLGHAAGDILLVQFAKLLSDTIRIEDTLARLGGDEFTIILPNIHDEKEPIKVVKRLLKKLAKPIKVNGKDFYVQVSIGIAIYPNDGETTDMVLNNADTAMYRAKKFERDQYVFYNKELELENINRLKYEKILKTAINKDHFVIHYQPQVNGSTGELIGLEALARINSPTEGLIPPYHFITLAEELDLISAVDKAIFRRVCQQYRRWKDDGIENVNISFNVSSAQLRDDHLVDKYMAYVHKYQVDPNDLHLEITENIIIENEKNALDLLTSFRDQGIKIALDDFGTGFSSLQCIYLYPIDIIKIDRMFISDILSNKKNVVIIQAIMSLAKALDISVIVEGVETKDQYEFLLGLGCNQIQGYYFSKPCPEDLIKPMLKKGFTFLQ